MPNYHDPAAAVQRKRWKLLGRALAGGCHIVPTVLQWFDLSAQEPVAPGSVTLVLMQCVWQLSRSVRYYTSRDFTRHLRDLRKSRKKGQSTIESSESLTHVS